MSEKSTRYAGIVGEATPLNPFGDDFADALQAWLLEILQIDSENVRPPWLDATAKVPDTADFATFAIDDYQRQPPVTLDQQQSQRRIEYDGTFNLRVFLRGDCAHSAALFLCDALDVNQNTDALDSLGLGLVDARVESLSQERVGQTFVDTAIAVLTFNYSYIREWNIWTLTSYSMVFRSNK